MILCLACGGEYRFIDEKADGTYRIMICKWCTDGGMSKNQKLAWQVYQRERRSMVPKKVPPPDDG